jgi:Integrase core domain
MASLNGSIAGYREAVLDMFLFQSLDEVRKQTEKWLQEYTEKRPHDSLGDMTPREYLLTHKPEISAYMVGPKHGRLTASLQKFVDLMQFAARERSSGRQ